MPMGGDHLQQKASLLGSNHSSLPLFCLKRSAKLSSENGQHIHSAIFKTLHTPSYTLAFLQTAQADGDSMAAPEVDHDQQSSSQIPQLVVPPQLGNFCTPQALVLPFPRAESVTDMSQPGHSPRPLSNTSGSQGARNSRGRQKKPWGSSAALKGGSSTSRGGSGGSNSNSRGKVAGRQAVKLQHQSSPRRGISQDNLRQGTGYSDSSLKNDSSRSEGGSPLHSSRRPAPRSPSFMDSTKSSQAHVHGSLSQGFGADSQQQQIHRPAFRPSGVHLVIDEAHGAEDAAEDKSQHAQHAQHGDGIHSPMSARSVHGHASSFMESTASSRAHHEQDLSPQHAQRGHDKLLNAAAHDELPASQRAAEMTQDGEEEPQAEVHGTQPAHVNGNVSHEHAHSERESSSRNFVNQTCLLHQTADEEVTFRPLDRTASLTEPKQRGFDESRRPSFMRPTASSIAHTVPTLPKGLDKSLSSSVV